MWETPTPVIGTKPRIKRCHYAVIPPYGAVVLGAYWMCGDSATGLTPYLAYQAWLLETKRTEAMTHGAAARGATGRLGRLLSLRKC